MADGGRPRRGGGRARFALTLGACLVLLGGAVATSLVIFASEPEAERETATRRSAALVETMVAERGTYHPRLEVLGRVTPARDVVLAPRVAGQVVEVRRALVPGGLVTAGQELLRIDPADFERLLNTRRAELRQVQAELEIEKGRQIVARQEFELLGEEIASANRSLVLREPQIAAVRARIEAAEEALAQAELDLQRTTVRAPFDAQVLERTVDVGSQVGPGDGLARLVGVDEAWVRASVPLRDLRWLRFPEDGEPGPVVELRHRSAWPADATREGRLARLVGTVDDGSRLARVLVTVSDPLGRAGDGPPLILDTIVELAIEGRPIADVVRLERELVRQGDTVWVMADGALEIRAADVVFRDAAHAYVRAGVEAGEHVVTTDLATVTEGLALRRAGASGEGGAEGSGDPGDASEERSR